MATRDHPEVRQQACDMLAAAGTAYIKSMMKDFYGPNFAADETEVMLEALTEAVVRVTAAMPEQKALLETFAYALLDRVKETK